MSKQLGPGVLEGKVALVTGGGTGIGEAVARQFVAAGARVCITGRRQWLLDSVAKSLPPGSVRTCAGDVSDADAAARMVATALKFDGTLDVLVNNAGSGFPGGVADIPFADWQRALDVNLTGPFLLMRAALPSMLAAGKGAIINVSSMAGLRGTPGTCAYAAAKGGLNILSQQVATEYGPRGIRCNVVCPGAVRTPQMDEAMTRLGGTMDPPLSNAADVYARLSENTPLRRVGHSSELAAVCVFLASDAAAYVTAAVITVDGGATAVDVNGVSLLERLPGQCSAAS